MLAQFKRHLRMLLDDRSEAIAFGASRKQIRDVRKRPLGQMLFGTRFGSFVIRPADSDLEVLRQVFVRREYDLDRYPQMAKLQGAYDEMLRKGETPVIIDAGANIGAASVWFAQLFPRAMIAAVEPEPGNAAITRTNTASYPNIRVFEAAIGSTAGNVKILPGELAWATRTERAETGLAVVTVPQLIATFDGGKLLVAKIDIEGFEADLFSENTDWCADAVAIFVEPHDWMLPGKGTSQSLQKVLGALSREVLILGENLVFI